MRFLRRLLPLAILSTIALDAAAGPAAGPAPAPRDAAKANDFHYAVYDVVRAEKGNVVFSATGMRQALGTAYLGARGSTASEMSSALRLDPDRAKAAAFARTETTDFLAAKGGASLSIANRLWTDTAFAPKRDFTQLASQAFGTGLEPLDFKGRAESSRIAINDWVSKHTNEKIKDLLRAGSVRSDTRAIITNAIWFEGNWASAFSVANTRTDDFFVDGTTPAKTPMMHQMHELRLAQAEGATMLELAYDKSDLAMDVLLPDANTGLAAIEDRVVKGGLDVWTRSLRSQQVAVSLPKLSVAWGKSMRGPLEKLGMQSAFDPNRADLTGMADAAGGSALYVSDVFHEAFVAIDEKGTEAAAASTVLIAPPSAPPARPFTADHPFLFVIRDTKQNRVLFMGRVADPTAPQH